MTNSQHFLDIANALIGDNRTSPAMKAWLDEARGDFGVSRSNVEALLNKTNWTAERPQIHVSASINQSESLTVRWLPTIGQSEANHESDFEFDRRFLGQVVLANQPYWSARPLGELMWFRKVPRSFFFAEDANSKVAVLAIVFGIKARYEELLVQVGRVLTITSADHILPRKVADDFIDWSFDTEEAIDERSRA